jgi:hypothetical protein
MKRRCIRIAVALALALSALLPSAAARSGVSAAVSPVDLSLPAGYVPAGYVAVPANSYALTRAGMVPLLGNYLTGVFVHNGWSAGFHGWLEASDPSGAAFVTYDLFEFRTTAGAQSVLTPYLDLMSGTETVLSDSRLPAGAAVFLDTAGTYGPGKPFAAAEVVFCLHNVLADATGYYDGGDAAADNGAVAAAIGAVAPIAAWLRARSGEVK